MNLATGAMGSLLPKLVELLKEEYKLKKGVKKDVESLSRELKSMHAALRKVAEVPRDQLDEQVRIWADDVRELSYKMEDVVDAFLVRVEGSGPPADMGAFKSLVKKMGKLFNKGKARHEIAGDIKDIKGEVLDVAARRDRYRVDYVEAKPMTTIDPRLRALYTEVTHLVGIDGKRDQELMRLLSKGDESNKKLRIVSVVGFGGLGKTTLVRAVYNKIKEDFDLKAFVPVGRNADAKKVFTDILLDLDRQNNVSDLMMLDERKLIDKLRGLLKEKSYIIVIDDIWDENIWGYIKSAFCNTDGGQIITTTRILSVAKACCSSVDGSVYEMKHLSDDESKSLFCKRIFPQRNDFPVEFKEVSQAILKKCGGVPLAIITIASLLACDEQIKPEDDWHVLLKSIGCGLTEDHNVDEMKRILLFSYLDLPSYLKTCLLYLSIFPEDHEIERDKLIWMWIAENFVQPRKKETSLFEIGETYFNELVNRSMIQPVYKCCTGGVEACRVHDMVLDLICFLSSDENFVTALDGSEVSTSSQRNVRRLALQNRKNNLETTPLISVSTSQVRSVAIFPPAFSLMPPLLRFVVLRLLDLSGCYLGKSSHFSLANIGTLFHLRYLGVRDTEIWELPAEIGKLQYLQVLDAKENCYLNQLPSSVFQLRRLMCLHIDVSSEMHLDGLGKLTFMEALGNIYASVTIVKELRNLERLRELEIFFSEGDLELEEAFLESLCNLHNIQILCIRGNFGSMDFLGGHWAPPRHLRTFDSHNVLDVFSTLPLWIKSNPAFLSNLSVLKIGVKELQQEDLRILGRLPALQSLVLESAYQMQKLLLIGAGGFRCLIVFTLYCWSSGQIVFQPGALPRTERVNYSFVRLVAEDDGDLHMGLGNLLSLREVKVRVCCDEVEVDMAKEAVDALRHELDAHPNHPTINIAISHL